MHVLFDSNSVQVLEQQSTGTRLNTLLGAMKSAGVSASDPWKISYTGGRITPGQLVHVSVLVVLTRDPRTSYAYTEHEIDAITSYVNGGGSLLLMTSHPPNFTNDAPLALRFGITLRPVFVSNPLVQDYAVNPMVMSGHSLNASLADTLLFQVHALVAHDSCEIAAPAGAQSIATFPSTAVTRGGQAPAYKDFALLLRSGSGNVIVTGNSGNICDYGSPAPACGLAPLGSNLQFFLNCVRFLNGLTNPRYPGLCPGQAA